MAVRFRKSLATLVRDLNRAGFSVLRVEHISSGRGRNADIHLSNDVVLSWDVPGQTLWAEGSTTRCEQVERYLRIRYERRGLKRKLPTAWYVFTALFRAPFWTIRERVRPENLTALQGEAAE